MVIAELHSTDLHACVRSHGNLAISSMKYAVDFLRDGILADGRACHRDNSVETHVVSSIADH